MALIFYLKFKFINLLSWKTNKSGIISFLLAIFGLIINIYFIKKVLVSNDYILDFEKIQRLFLLTFYVATICRIFIPNYTSLQEIAPLYFPIGNIRKFCYNFINSILNIYLLMGFLLLFLLKTYINEEFFENYLIVKYCFAVVYASIFRRVLQYFFEKKIVRGYILIGILIQIACCFCVHFCLYIYTGIIINILLLLATLFGLYWFEVKCTFSSISTFSKINLSNINLTILFGNQMARVSLFMGVIFKVFILTTITYSYFRKGTYPPYFIVYLFLLPTFPFTYVFNNTWGILKSTWLYTDLTTGSGKKSFKRICSFIALPLLVDFIITSIFLSIHHQFLIDGLLSYMTSAILFSVMSFYWSLIFIIPQSEKWSVATRNTTSIISTFFTIIITALLSLSYLSAYFKILHVCFLIISGFLFFSIEEFYKGRRKTVFETLFKI